MMKIKNNKFYFFLIVIATMVNSCANENTVAPDVTPSEVSEGVTCVIPEPEYDIDGVISRSTITPSSTGMSFSWDEGEKINIYGSDQSRMDFTLISMDESGKTGKFNGGGFDLTADKVYYSISKSSSTYGTNNDKHNIPSINDYKDFNSDQWTNIKLTYDGQRQTVNEETFGGTPNAYAHLGAYDYMTASATASSNNSATFNYSRLSCILRIVVNGLPEGVAFKQLTMYDASENKFREMKRTANITNSSSSTSYNPYLNEVTLTDDSPRFSIMLGTQNSDKEEQGISVSSGQSLVVYMMIPPVDLTGRTIAFRLTPVASGSTPYFCTYKGRAFASNKAVQMTMKAQACDKYNINVKVVQDWEKGNVKEDSRVVSRSTGDPGKTLTLTKPKYLYAFFVNNAKLVGRAYAADIAETDWTDANGIYSYTGSWKNTSNGTNETETTSLTLDAANGTNPRVYIIASKTSIDFSGTSFSYGTSDGTAESVIQGLTYAYSDQDQMLNLYSTPYVDGSSFTGALNDDVKDVRLYHVASKVDINWENTTTTALSGSVSVNNFPTTNLSFFKPTTNAAASGTISTAIDTGTAYNGRAVFYVPQVSGGTYNVTVGGTTKNIQFTPDATYTSWFRGLVTIGN